MAEWTIRYRPTRRGKIGAHLSISNGEPMKRSRTGRILAASAAFPALLLGTGGAAPAAANTLTLTALNRSGGKVAISATVVNVDSRFQYTVKTGTPKTLPKGTYAVLMQINTGSTTTLGGTAVQVSGSTKLTVDARKGKRVGLALSPTPAWLPHQITARVCAQSSPSYYVEGYGDQVYVIPSSSKKVSFGALGWWTDMTGTTDSYAVLNQTTAGVPSSPTRTYAKSALAHVLVDSRRGPGGANFSDVAVQPAADGCGSESFAELVTSDVPTTSTLHLSPTSWSVRSDEFATAKATGNSLDIGGYSTVRKVAAGKSYGIRFYGATWGPGRSLPYIAGGTLTYTMNDGFEDPALPDGYGSVEGGDKATAALKFNGKTVKIKKDTGWMPTETYISYDVKKSGWFTLTNVATRYDPDFTYPAGMLSTASVATFCFPAKPKTNVLAPVYALQMVPAGLDHYNRAKPKSTTNVAFRLSRDSLPDLIAGKNPTVKSVTAKMSADGGKTWRSVPVKKIGGGWVALVGNPSGGAVSLLARATYTSGAYTEVAVYRAYGIG